MRHFIFAFVCLFTAFRCPADGVDDYVKCQMRRYHIPGVSLAIVKERKVIKAKSYGLASVELNVPATKDTIYQIGSVTKVFTATAVMMLVNDGKIRLDDRITNYVSGLPPAWSGITVRHLLSHTSGITNDYADVGETSTRLRNPLSPEQFLESATNFPLASVPGEKWAYSNSGYYLLGLIIEKASGKSYADFMKQRIFVTLGMHSTGVNSLETVVTNRAGGYSWWNYGGLHNGNYWDISWAFSAGGITSSVMDLARWDAALYTDELLPKARLEQMWTLEAGQYPLGWGVDISKRYGRALNHFGGTPGSSSGIQRWIDQRLAIIVLANMQAVPSWDIVEGVSYFYLPDLIKPKKDDQPELTHAHRELLSAAVAGALDPELFAEEERKEFFPDKAAQLRSELMDPGSMKSFYLLDETLTDAPKPHRVRHYRAVFNKERLRVEVELGDNGKARDLRVAFK